jgi:outer membrane protein assembly factor BamB
MSSSSAPSTALVALNVVDGKSRWSAPTTKVTHRYLSLSERLLMAADHHGTLHTFVPSTGEPEWTAEADADCAEQVTSRFAGGGNRVFAASTSTLHALPVF